MNTQVCVSPRYTCVLFPAWAVWDPELLQKLFAAPAIGEDRVSRTQKGVGLCVPAVGYSQAPFRSALARTPLGLPDFTDTMSLVCS